MKVGKKRGDVAPEVAQKNRIIDYKKVFSGEQGYEVLLDLLNRYHLLSAKELTAFQQGQRAVVADILLMCRVDLEQFDKIVKGEFE